MAASGLCRFERFGLHGAARTQIPPIGGRKRDFAMMTMRKRGVAWMMVMGFGLSLLVAAASTQAADMTIVGGSGGTGGEDPGGGIGGLPGGSGTAGTVDGAGAGGPGGAVNMSGTGGVASNGASGGVGGAGGITGGGGGGGGGAGVNAASGAIYGN